MWNAKRRTRRRVRKSKSKRENEGERESKWKKWERERENKEKAFFCAFLLPLTDDLKFDNGKAEATWERRVGFTVYHSSVSIPWLTSKRREGFTVYHPSVSIPWLTRKRSQEYLSKKKIKTIDRRKKLALNVYWHRTVCRNLWMLFVRCREKLRKKDF